MSWMLGNLHSQSREAPFYWCLIELLDEPFYGKVPGTSVATTPQNEQLRSPSLVLEETIVDQE